MSFAHVPSIARRAFMPMVVAALAMSFAAQDAMAGCNNIIYGGTQHGGKPGWGQTVMVTGSITRCDRGPVANQQVELWFSTQKGLRAGSVRVRTDRYGRFSAMMTIPSNWRGVKFVDVNIACPSIRVMKLFRVRTN
jgi:hypothetical protein